MHMYLILENIQKKDKMNKHIGELFIQRTRKQYRLGQPTTKTTKKAIFWKITTMSDDKGNLIRCTVENDDGDEYRGRVGYIDMEDTTKGMELRILNQFDLDYQCYGSSGIAYNKERYHFPLKDYHNAQDWMQDFHRKLGHPIPNEDTVVDCGTPKRTLEYPDAEVAVPTEDNMVDYDTPKRKRSDSLDTCPRTPPPTPKKAKRVGRFTVHHAIKNLNEELKKCTNGV